MKVGDLVKFKDNDQLGLIIANRMCRERGNEYFHVQWVDGFLGIRFPDELEIISESR